MGKTILFDYSVGGPLLPQVVRAESCCQKTRQPAGRGRDASRTQCAREADGSICYNPPLSYIRLVSTTSHYKQ